VTEESVTTKRQTENSTAHQTRHRVTSISDMTAQTPKALNDFTRQKLEQEQYEASLSQADGSWGKVQVEEDGDVDEDDGSEDIDSERPPPEGQNVADSRPSIDESAGGLNTASYGDEREISVDHASSSPKTVGVDKVDEVRFITKGLKLFIIQVSVWITQQQKRIAV